MLDDKKRFPIKIYSEVLDYHGAITLMNEHLKRK